MPHKKVIECSHAIAERGWKIAFAESMTAGKLASEFSLTPNSGNILLGGVVSYDASVKKELLQVPTDAIAQYSCESHEVTKIMAENLKNLFSAADIRMAVTGLAAPGGSETEEKPVGTVFIHIILPGKCIQHREIFKGKPEKIISNTVKRIAKLLLKGILIK